MKCVISWIDANGQATPDENDAIGYVHREAYTAQVASSWKGAIYFDKTERFPICAEHAKRLTERGMEHWHFEPLTEEDKIKIRFH